jgi:hypothetical protein
MTIRLLMLFGKYSLSVPRITKNLLNTLYTQNNELVIVKAGGTYTYHWALKS